MASRAQTARGVPGERPAAGTPSARYPVPTRLCEAVHDHGANVPNFTIEGPQHERVPFKHKGQFATVTERDEWTRIPKHRSKTEMKQHRREQRIPDISCDVDGDGQVGQRDFFIAKQFSKEKENRLNTAEREQVVQAIENGWLENFAFGLEQAGPKRPYPVRQMRGKIITIDNGTDLNQVYPPHWNHATHPPYPTKTEMMIKRKADLKNSAFAVHEKHTMAHPVMVPEDPPTQEFSVSDPLMSSITERREAIRREARRYAGLDAEGSHENPDRMGLDPGLAYVEQPEFNTRSELREGRKAKLRADLDRARLQAESEYLPPNARYTYTDAMDYDNRRPDPQAMTFTKLKQLRKQQKVEHDMLYFQRPAAEGRQVQPTYSGQTEPFWTMQGDFVQEPPTCRLKAIREPHPDVAGNITQHDPTSARMRSVPLEASSEQAMNITVDKMPKGHNEDFLKSRRWMKEFPKHQHSGEPSSGLFDGVKQAQTFSLDGGPMKVSSFEVISKNDDSRDRARQRRTALEDEERARAWRSGQMFTDMTDVGSVTMEPHEKLSPEKTGTFHSLDASSRASSRMAAATMPGTRFVGRSEAPMVPQLPISLVPKGEDPPMTERLERLRHQAMQKGTPSVPTAPDDDMSRPKSPPEAVPRASAAGGAAARRGETARLSARGDAARQRTAVQAASVQSGSPPRANADLSMQAIVVRTGGFQWLNRQQAAGEEESNHSVVQPSPRDSSRNLGTDTAMLQKSSSRGSV
eukprot:gnl/TRDRNA2_/TRDRNA2_44754_c0_seq1.p1 gnl/TRDRNA2_/TRDRNA2_44754_c0~~gnl/TRDRNA2_/TRDRNA2_44754_c0_seq1.p1  ORF type:complete len:749 (+),score=117.63 gnl/TRDRNA2_/TRDRNA2_44754_c0_seq1:58-2304(+)